MIRRRAAPPPASPARVGTILLISAAASVVVVRFIAVPWFVDVPIVLACALVLGLIAGHMAKRVRGRRR